jgi:hypothetical protein
MGRWRWWNWDRRTKKMSPLKTSAKWVCLGRLGTRWKRKGLGKAMECSQRRRGRDGEVELEEFGTEEQRRCRR